MPLLVQTPL